MDRLIAILFPKVSIDEVLFQKAPTDTLRAFVKHLQGRLVRVEALLIFSIVSPYVPFSELKPMLGL